MEAVDLFIQVDSSRLLLNDIVNLNLCHSATNEGQTTTTNAANATRRAKLYFSFI